MKTVEIYCFATDALVRVAVNDPACIPLRLFFDQQVRVLTTKQCYEEAFDVFSRDQLNKTKARSTFAAYLDKVEFEGMDADPKKTKELMDRYSLDESAASLIAGTQNLSRSANTGSSEYYLVTAEEDLISAAKKEGVGFQKYTEEEFCSKYGS